jgi:predicted  nucleic acid-binding Zn-ribbon protein
VKELSKEVQDIKMEVETIKKSQMEAILKMENLGTRSGATDASINNRIQEIEERISGIEDIDTTLNQNTKCTEGTKMDIKSCKRKRPSNI